MRSAINTMLVIAGLICTLTLSAQDQTVEFPQGKLRIRKAFEVIEAQSGLSVAYNEDLLDVNKKVTPPKSETVSCAMEILLHGTGMEAIFQGKLILVVLSEKAQSESLSAKDEKDIYVNMLEEAVVVGYGTMQKKDITSAISTYRPLEKGERQVGCPDALLQGRVAGVNVTASSGTPGSRNRVSIRGIGSLTAGNEPLYVVDGIPLSNTSADAGKWGGETLNPLADINPADIESIQILKDAASAAIYGSRGTNGVILITTKKGYKGAPKVTADASTSISYIPNLKKLAVADADLYLQVQNEAIDNYNRQTGSSVSHLSNPFPDRAQFNWTDVVFRTAFTWNGNLSVSGGSQRNRYYISANARQNQGTVIGSRLDKYGVKATVTSDIRDWLSVGMNLTASHTYSDRVPDGNMGTSILTHALEHRPWDTPYHPDGSYTIKDVDLLHYNLIQAINEQDVYNRNFRMFGSAYLSVTPIKGLKFKTSIGGDFMYAEDHIYYTAKHMYGNSVGLLTDARKAYTSVVIDNILSYGCSSTRGFAMDIMLGHSFQKDASSTASQTGQGFPSSDFDVNSVAAEYTDVTSGMSSWALQSFMFRTTLKYQSRYLLTLTARADGSSKFARENRYGFFPSASAGWVVSKEPFWTAHRTEFKLRTSFGVTGNQGGIGAYAYQALANGGYNYLNENGIALMTQGNRDLRWEKASQYDIGADLSFWSGALTVSADLFQKDTKDLLYNKPTSAVSGFTYRTSNIGSMRNRGLELTIGSELSGYGILWKGDFNISFIKNRLTSLLDDNDIVTTDDYHALKVDEEVGSFYMIRMLGIYQDDSQVPETLYKQGVRAGDVIYEDVNGDGEIDTVNDSQFVGSANPVFSGGLNNSISWKGFDLSLFLTFSYGNKIYQTWTGGLRLGNGEWPAQRSEALARWTGPGTSRSVPRAIYGMSWNSTKFKSTRFLHDASYLRCRNLSLGYTIPPDKSRMAGMTSIRVYVAADNLFLISPYRYIDPEVNTSLDATKMGLDCMWTPQPRSFTFGVTVKF